MHGTNHQIKECIDLRACSYSSWYKNFQKISLDSICIPLSDKIVSYLLDEIIILPKECYPNDDDEKEENKEDGDDEDEEVVVSVLLHSCKQISTKTITSQFMFALFSSQSFPNSVHHCRRQFLNWEGLSL